MNPALAQLHPYPFERLAALLAGIAPPAGVAPIGLQIGEPRHAAPAFVLDELWRHRDGYSKYPKTAGEPWLREAIADWLRARYRLPEPLLAARHVLPVNGSREALFAFVQCIAGNPAAPVRVAMPNPFYQIYEGAALLAGATPYCVNSLQENAFAPRWADVPEAVWARTQLLYVCSPDNPTGRVVAEEEWRQLFELSDRYGFAIAADECYSEVYFDETKPPLGALAAAQSLGRDGYPRLLVFGSLSKRSNAPGLRSGYVAGDAELVRSFLLYRTYHGSAMSPAVATASIAAWNDEVHVRANRALYREKFERLTPLAAAALPTAHPAAAFYLWHRVPDDDAQFARRLYAEEAVSVLPGSYLGREADGVNPGRGYVRIALVASFDECAEAVDRLVRFVGRS
jgi:N-succinyldiaminopimelate aminotransferase